MVVNNLYNVIVSPVITEKATKISENNQYVFKVSISSDKKIYSRWRWDSRYDVCFFIKKKEQAQRGYFD